MALIKCSECGKEISDKSEICIHCGYPLDLQLPTNEVSDADLSNLINEADKLIKTHSYTEALALYEKAAVLGNDIAQLWLGNIYSQGLGVEKDYEKASQWFEKSAEQGNLTAINNLGFLYAHGYGVQKDIIKSTKFYKKASELGNKYAINNLGVCYMDGIGIEQDFKKAEELFNKAIKLGDKTAEGNLKILQERISQATKNTPQEKPLVARKGFWLFIIAVILFGMLYLSSVDDNSNRTCAWCNGTGYNGNGASTVEEYVFMKTPCKHCKGKGTY